MPVRRLTPCWLVLVAACLHAPKHPEATRAANACARHLQDDRLDEAEAECALGLEFAPDDADLWVNRGLVLLRRGKKVRAREAFETALANNPDALQAHNNLGVLDLGAGATARAAEHFEEALRIDPRYLAARLNLALARHRLGAAEEARRQLRIAVVIDPGFVAGWRAMGVLALEAREHALAAEAFGRWAELAPDAAEAWQGLGSAEARRGRDLAARAAFEACLRADPWRIACRQGREALAETR
jgi:tetratricopeptide (TPR) repeat protein